MNYTKGDYTKCLEDICEIWYEDNLYCIVRTDDADKIIDVLNENEQLKSRIEYLERKMQRERNSTQKQYAKWEKEAETKIKELSEENEQLKQREQTLTAKIDRILHQRDGNEKQHLKVMSYLHDNYYSIWEECLKELGD